MGVSYNGVIVRSGLVGYWDAANPRSYPGSGTAWNDVSGNSNHATTGSTFSATNGGCMYYNGTQYTGTARNDIANNSSLTISSWFKLPTVSAVYLPLIDAGNFGLGEKGFTLSTDNTKRPFMAINGGYKIADNILTDNTWYNITGTAQAGTPYTLSMYVNGILQTPYASGNTNELTYNQSDIKFFRNTVGFISYTTGYLSNVQIYNRALSASEVQQNFNALRGRFGI